MKSLSVLIVPVIIAIGLAFGAGVSLYTYAGAQIAAGLMIVFWVSVAGTSVVAVVTVATYTWLAYQRGREASARADLARREADMIVVTAPADHQVITAERGHNLHWRHHHLDPNPTANGVVMLPSPSQCTRWVAWQTLHAPHPASQSVGRLPDIIATETVRRPLLDVLSEAQRTLIVGASNAGKTTLLQHVITQRLTTSRVVVIDPHASPDRWPAAAQVVGPGRDYDAIGQALQALLDLMTRRYKEIGAGQVREGKHEPITVIIDEWWAIKENLPGAGRIIATLLVESRKAAFSVFVGTHSDRVKGLGIEGQGDLRDGFVMVRLTNVKGQHRATVDFGDGEIEATPPGPFVTVRGDGEPVPVLEFTAPKPEPKINPDRTGQDAEFARLVQDEGYSKRQAALRAYGMAYAGYYATRGDRALGEI